MREILFRGKECINEAWIYGGIVFEEADDALYGGEDIPLIKPIDDMEREVIPETVGQYTGLTDKNGVKIFEGDIMVLYAGLIRPKIIVIAWSDYCCGWCAKYKDDEYEIPTKSEILGRMEIIGNIHDTPELLGWE
jgi:uncharacterized phage protein (TIGR01671 family)